MDYIFIHWGPASNPDAEKIFLSPRLKIKYIDQSGISNLDDLKSIHDKELKLCRDFSNTSIIAHSFGASILRMLSIDLLNSFKSIFFIAPSFNFFKSCVNLFNFIAEMKSDNTLKSLVKEFEQGNDLNVFWKCFTLINESYPDYFSYYWCKKSSFETYLGRINDIRKMNSDDLVTILEELHSFKLESEFRFLKKLKNCKYLIGDNDPFFDKKSIDSLKELGPTHKVRLLKQTGHFPHFENDLKYLLSIF